jgi:hypothetical protein
MNTKTILEQAKKGKTLVFKMKCICKSDYASKAPITGVKENGCVYVTFMGIKRFVVDPTEIEEII